MKVNIFKYLS